MQSICLFEAGGTKTTVLHEHQGHVVTYELPGFNPNRYSPDFEKALVQVNLPADARVFFYGSGLSSETNKEIVRKILAAKFTAKAEINHDQIGAARAAWGDSEGLVGILGTGAFAAWYNGRDLVDRKGGHGYLIDDIGGGFEMGKLMLSAWLNGDLPEEADQAISRYVKISKNDFTTEFYKNPDLQLVAGVARIIEQYQENQVIRELLIQYFDLYFHRHINPILQKHPSKTLGLVGGIAEAFGKIVSAVATSYGISTVFFLENPAFRLLKYHQERM